MSYYRGSMSIRGRGSSFRGNSYRGGSSSYRGSSSTYRGSNSYGDRGSYSSSSSRGGRYQGTNTSYSSGYQDTRSRYATSADKYNSRGRDEGYRRSSYRSEDTYSSSRDHSRGSPDRKRMRTEQGSSSRRSNDGGYTGSGGGAEGYGNQRYENSGGGGYAVERRYSSERHPRSPKDFRGRNESSLYTKASDSASMPPPRSTRGTFRGRMSTRGMRARGVIRRTDGFVRTRRAPELYTKRRVIPRSLDNARRLKIQKMRSAIKKRESGSSNDSDKEDWDGEMEKLEKKKKSAEDKDETTPIKKKSPKKEKSEKKADSGNEGSDKEENAGSGDEGKGESDKEGDSKETPPKDLPRSRYTGRSFIKLTCVHCSTKCVTFKEYLEHMQTSRHLRAMKRLAIKHKAELAKMRLMQRNSQRELDSKNIGLRSLFCPTCKLNYRQFKANHQMSEAHRDMMKFLMPYCSICRLTCKSPMLYEVHVCSLDHIKRKARLDYLKSKRETEEASGDEGIKELDLDNFMTLDSVGDVDEDVEEEEEGEDGEKKTSPETEKKPKAPENEINVGIEHVRKVEVYYCDLCKMYLQRYELLESAVKKHCKSRNHLRKYVRFRDDEDLRLEAERIHRENWESKEKKEKEAEKMETSSTASTPKVKKDTEASNGTPNASKNDSLTKEMENGSVDEEDAVDDKLWADVDKDLGELLREVEPNKSSDDEDDSRATSGRYDRFRYSDKKGGTDDKSSTKADDSKNEDQNEILENSDKVKAEEK